MRRQKIGNLSPEQKTWVERCLKSFEDKEQFYRRFLDVLYDHISRENSISYRSLAQDLGCHVVTVGKFVRSNAKIGKIIAAHSRMHTPKCVAYEQNAVAKRVKKRYARSRHCFDPA